MKFQILNISTKLMFCKFYLWLPGKFGIPSLAQFLGQFLDVVYNANSISEYVKAGWNVDNNFVFWHVLLRFVNSLDHEEQFSNGVNGAEKSKKEKI